MPIVLSQIVGCEPRYIAMKSETNVKHQKKISKRNSINSKMHDKKIKKYANIMKMVLHFYKNYCNILVDQWFSKFKLYTYFKSFAIPHVYDKILQR